MAKVSNLDGKKVRGKLNKKSNEVHRVINGKEFQHTIENPYNGPASKAQKLHRSNFGKISAIVNTIMADPAQVAQWEQKMREYNLSLNIHEPPYPKRYETVRQYLYAFIGRQIEQSPAAKRRKARLPLTLPKGIRFQAKQFSDLTTKELYEILKARFTVFVAEQHIHYVDEDNIDYHATHFSLRRRGIVLAYARMFPVKEKGVYSIGRMLTLERGQGFAKYLMEQMIHEARTRQAHKLRLHAQMQAAPFYEHLGFHTVGDIFSEAELPHVLMEMTLD